MLAGRRAIGGAAYARPPDGSADSPLRNGLARELHAAAALFLAAVGGQAAVLDFETVNSVAPTEGMAISNQFQAYYGISFRRSDGGYPVITKKGPPRASILVPVDSDLDLYDTLHPDDPRAGNFGDFSLTDDGIVGGTKQIILDFSAPVSRASGFLLDIDNSERMTITAYADDGISQVDQVVISAGDPETGNGRSTSWIFVHATNDIRQIRFRETGSSANANVAFDNFDSDYTPPPATSSALGLQMLAGLVISGEAGRPYRIEYADRLSPTNWLSLTNLFLPTSPFLFVDTTSTNSPQRFYRAVNMP